jgi:hypothetical protein
MAYVIAAPEMMASAATDVATIGSNVSAAHMAAAAPTLALIPAAADEVSAGIAQLFSQHAQGYQAQAAQAAAFQEPFVQHLTAGAFSYAGIDAALASLLQNWQNLNVNADLQVGLLATEIPSIVSSLPPQKALLFLLALAIDIPVLFLPNVYLYFIFQSLPAYFL